MPNKAMLINPRNKSRLFSKSIEKPRAKQEKHLSGQSNSLPESPGGKSSVENSDPSQVCSNKRPKIVSKQISSVFFNVQ